MLKFSIMWGAQQGPGAPGAPTSHPSRPVPSSPPRAHPRERGDRGRFCRGDLAPTAADVEVFEGKSTIFKNGKPSIMSHLYHGYVSHNQGVNGFNNKWFPLVISTAKIDDFNW